MVEVLSGNFSVWGQSLSGMRTTFDGGTKTFSFFPPNLDPRTVNPAKQIANMTQMKLFGGVFVGMIFHVNVNQLPDFPVIFEFIKTENNGTTIIDTGVQCIIQRTAQNPNATGFFYSNTDISEFTRTFQKGEYIQIHQLKTANTCFQRTGPGNLHILLDLDIPPPILPP